VRTLYLTYLILLGLIIPIIRVCDYLRVQNYEDPHYVIFFSILLLLSLF
jgi:hypothetical protein